MLYQGISKTVYDIEGKKFAGGGEGTLHFIHGNDKQVAKIFKQGKRDTQREEKLCLMVRTKLSEEQLKQVTWPQDVIYDKEGFAGYIMPKIENASSLTEIYTSNAYDLRYRLMAAVNLCAAVDTVHGMGQVCGDLNPQNICVNLNKAERQNAFKVTLVDTDSYHFTSGDKTYRCEVGLGEFIAPELQNKMTNGLDLKSVPLPSYTRQTDLFALAVHLFYLLMNGCHPFACAKTSSRQDSNIEQMQGGNTPDSVIAPQPVENVKTGYFPFYEMREGITIPIYAPKFKSLPPQIRDLFVRTFVEGYTDPQKRVSAMEWMNALRPLLNSIVECAADTSHFYFNVSEKCPLCKVERKTAELYEQLEWETESEPDQPSALEEEPSSQQQIWNQFSNNTKKSRLWIDGGMKAAIGVVCVVAVLIIVSLFENGISADDSTQTVESSIDTSSQADGEEQTQVEWKEIDYPYAGIKVTAPDSGDSVVSDDIEHARIPTGLGGSEISFYVTKSIKDFEGLSLNKKPSKEVQEYYKEYYNNGKLLDFNTVKLGENYFIKMYCHQDDYYSISYYAYEDITVYEFTCLQDTEFTDSDIGMIEKIISSLYIYHHRVYLSFIGNNGKIIEISEKEWDDGLWKIFLIKGDVYNEELHDEIVLDRDSFDSLGVMISPGKYTGRLVHETGENYDVTESYDLSFEVSDIATGEYVNVHVNK